MTLAGRGESVSCEAEKGQRDCRCKPDSHAIMAARKEERIQPFVGASAPSSRAANGAMRPEVPRQGKPAAAAHPPVVVSGLAVHLPAGKAWKATRNTNVRVGSR